MEYEKQPQTTTDAPVKIYQPQVKSVAVRQQTGRNSKHPRFRQHFNKTSSIQLEIVPTVCCFSYDSFFCWAFWHCSQYP